jgi:hypothetical protein
LWLHCFRRVPPWLARWQEPIHQALSAGGASAADLFALDDGSGELISTVWHLLWCGALTTDMTLPWNANTVFTWPERLADA